MKRAWSYLLALGLLTLFSLGAVLATLRAAAEPAAQERGIALPAGGGAPAAPAAAPADPDPAIQDDREVAPDAQESADNNVTFPVDI